MADEEQKNDANENLTEAKRPTREELINAANNAKPPVDADAPTQDVKTPEEDKKLLDDAGKQGMQYAEEIGDAAAAPDGAKATKTGPVANARQTAANISNKVGAAVSGPAEDLIEGRENVKSAIENVFAPSLKDEGKSALLGKVSNMLNPTPEDQRVIDLRQGLSDRFSETFDTAFADHPDIKLDKNRIAGMVDAAIAHQVNAKAAIKDAGAFLTDKVITNAKGDTLTPEVRAKLHQDIDADMAQKSTNKVKAEADKDVAKFRSEANRPINASRTKGFVAGAAAIGAIASVVQGVKLVFGKKEVENKDTGQPEQKGNGLGAKIVGFTMLALSIAGVAGYVRRDKAVAYQPIQDTAKEIAKDARIVGEWTSRLFKGRAEAGKGAAPTV